MNKTKKQIDCLVRQCRKIVKCDTARIFQSDISKYLFLIIGFNRNTKDDKYQWLKNNKPYYFDYVAEHVVASGNTNKELLESAKEYKRLCGMTMLEYLSETINDKESFKK